jgi:6-phosphogluconolactonase
MATITADVGTDYLTAENTVGSWLLTKDHKRIGLLFYTAAEIRVHPSGRFLYTTNRGHNSVAMFEIEPETGEIEVIGWESTRGEWPRGMNIDPSGTLLYAANQNTDDIAVFRIQQASGRLSFSTLVNTPTPVDVEFGPFG